MYVVVLFGMWGGLDGQAYIHTYPWIVLHTDAGRQIDTWARWWEGTDWYCTTSLDLDGNNKRVFVLAPNDSFCGLW
ncbi:hypothetical protein QBC43DRAFT_308321 [Cladorrhinum sp. PSN259]|nr:hypothetical protein QBC43DRAFT_308321 [Cladorrhinum sp. PSN259]